MDFPPSRSQERISVVARILSQALGVALLFGGLELIEFGVLSRFDTVGLQVLAICFTIVLLGSTCWRAARYKKILTFAAIPLISVLCLQACEPWGRASFQVVIALTFGAAWACLMTADLFFDAMGCAMCVCVPVSVVEVLLRKGGISSAGLYRAGGPFGDVVTLSTLATLSAAGLSVSDLSNPFRRISVVASWSVLLSTWSRGGSLCALLATLCGFFSLRAHVRNHTPKWPVLLGVVVFALTWIARWSSPELRINALASNAGRFSTWTEAVDMAMIPDALLGKGVGHVFIPTSWKINEISASEVVSDPKSLLLIFLLTTGLPGLCWVLVAYCVTLTRLITQKATSLSFVVATLSLLLLGLSESIFLLPGRSGLAIILGMILFEPKIAKESMHVSI